MFSDFLFCVFSYNRGNFLQNLLDSVTEFYPEASVAIFDDGSDDTKVKEILKEWAGRSYIYVTDKTAPDCKHGGLYDMMNVAIEYAKDSKFSYAYFVQDDMQFLWRDEELHGKMENVFQHDNCLMCNCNFLLKIFKNDTIYELNKIDDTGVCSFTKHGVGDTGIIDLDKARKHNLTFPFHAERQNGEYWFSKGFRLYWLPQANLAWMPWPKVYRYKTSEREKVHKLKFINSNRLEQLKLNSGYAFMEDYLTTDTFLMKPYWHGASHGRLNMIKIYTKYFLGMPLLKHDK